VRVVYSKPGRQSTGVATTNDQSLLIGSGAVSCEQLGKVRKGLFTAQVDQVLSAPVCERLRLSVVPMFNNKERSAMSRSNHEGEESECGY
jgi:hypothetical protein